MFATLYFLTESLSTAVQVIALPFAPILYSKYKDKPRQELIEVKKCRKKNRKVIFARGLGLSLVLFSLKFSNHAGVITFRNIGKHELTWNFASNNWHCFKENTLLGQFDTYQVDFQKGPRRTLPSRWGARRQRSVACWASWAASPSRWSLAPSTEPSATCCPILLHTKDRQVS